MDRLAGAAATLSAARTALTRSLTAGPGAVPLPWLVAPDVTAEPVELAIGAGAFAIGIFGCGAFAALGTAFFPAAPSAPAALGSGAGGGGGGGGGAVIVTVKVDSTLSTAWAVKSGAKARIRPRIATTCSSATSASTPSRVRRGVAITSRNR